MLVTHNVGNYQLYSYLAQRIRSCTPKRKGMLLHFCNSWIGFNILCSALQAE